MDEAPFAGVTVVDLGQIYNASYATFLLALGGADVIKVEPLTGENLRGRGRVAGAGAPFAMLNSNKRAVTLNLKAPEGVALLEKMVEKADVFVENFRPGVTDRLGIGFERLSEINPRLVYASGSGYGSTGPYRDLPAMDITIQAMSGIMSVTGFPDRDPVKAGPAVSDFMGGIHLYGAIAAGLYQRERTGKGTAVEAAMLDSVYPSLMSSLGLYFGSTGEAPTRTGNRHSGMAEAPYNVYPASDGHIALICVSEGHWRALAGLMGRPELIEHPDYVDRVARVRIIDEVDAQVGSWTRQFTKAELVQKLQTVGVPSAPVRQIAEVVADPHLRQRGMLVEMDHPQEGPLVMPHSPIRVGDHYAQLVPSPTLGQHNEQVYGEWLGLDAGTIAELHVKGVI
ncbi:MAG: CoA transferase [Frankiales bacterium]|jgi:CoA:oxalate CoA-transferase|nr:CoA transferase [Frankiales bacterium]